jgi:hypothetical protein
LPLALDNERFRRGSSSRCRPAAASLVLLLGGLACYSQATGNLRPGDAEGHGMIDEEGQLGVEILPLRSHPGGSIEYVGWGKANIAVALVADAAASASDITLIVSADSDLCPAIRTARTLNPKRRMIAAFPPRRSSFEIRSLIRKPLTLAAADIRNSLLPEVVTDPVGGRVHKRPGKWR